MQTNDLSCSLYSFGMQMPERSNTYGNSDVDYRYAFQGMEQDNEVSGNGNSYTTFFRQYDNRLGRWKSLDPVVHHNQSPYCSMDNNPIIHNDPRGDDVGYGSKKDERRVKRKAFFNKTFRAEHQARINDKELHVYMKVKNKPRLENAVSEFKWTNDYGQVENWVEYDRIGFGGGTGGGGFPIGLREIDVNWQISSQRMVQKEKTIHKSYVIHRELRKKNGWPINWRHKANYRHKLKRPVDNDSNHGLIFDAQNIPDHLIIKDDGNETVNQKLGGTDYVDENGNVLQDVLPYTPTSKRVIIKVTSTDVNDRVSGNYKRSNNTDYSFTYWRWKGRNFSVNFTFKIPCIKCE